MVDVGGVPMVATGGYGNGDCGWGGGGMLGLILILALFGGCGFGGGFGRGHGCGEGGYDHRGDYNWIREGQFGLQKDVLENRFVSEKNTGAIIASQDKNTCAILEKMAGIEMQNLRDKVSGLETALSEQRITGTILASLQPQRPIPAYNVPNPYANYGNCGFPQGCC